MPLPPLTLTEAFLRIGRIRLDESDLDAVLARIASLAKQTVPGADEVSVTLMRGSQAHSAAYTGDLAATLDQWQYANGSGPCLDAATTGSVMAVTDMAREQRWPQWARHARSAGAGSSLSIGLPIQEAVVGALNIYRIRAGGFDGVTPLAQTFAGYAAIAMANAHLYDRTATLAQQMQTAMESRAIIEQAKGIVMGERRCTADEAFTVLSRASQDSNRKLREVAQALVDWVTDRPSPPAARSGQPDRQQEDSLSS